MVTSVTAIQHAQSVAAMKHMILQCPDSGNGWRSVNDERLWSHLYMNGDSKNFEFDHYQMRIRIKPTLDDLMNQIEDWETETKRELVARDRAEGLFK